MSDPKIVITHPDAIGPAAQTLVPCPACNEGMVKQHVARLVKEALAFEPTASDVDLCERDGHRPCAFGCNRCLVCEYCKCTQPKVR